MGRGCSDLQKRILVLALFNGGGEVRREHNYPHRPDLYVREVMTSIYKLKADFVPDAEWDSDGTLRRDRPIRDRRGWVFERERFDEFQQAFWNNDFRVQIKAYNAAIAATVRAFARLEQRGLVRRWRRDAHAASGIVLTPAGYQTALAHLKELDPDRYQRVMSLLGSRSNNGLMVKN